MTNDLTVSGNFTTVTGTFTTVTGTNASFTNITGVTVVGTTTVSGATVTGTNGNFVTVNATNVNCTGLVTSGGVFAFGTVTEPAIRFRETQGANALDGIYVERPVLGNQFSRVTVATQQQSGITIESGTGPSAGRMVLTIWGDYA